MFDVNGNDLADSGDSCRREQGSRARGRRQNEQGRGQQVGTQVRRVRMWP